MSEEAAKAKETRETQEPKEARKAEAKKAKETATVVAEKKEEKKAKKTEAKSGAAKLDKLVDEIGSLTLLELSELVETLKERFSIQAIAIPSAAAAAGGSAGSPAEAPVEKSEFDIVLTDVGGQKLQVLKEVRSITSLGLKEAKELIDNLPGTVKEAAGKDEAEEIKKKLESVGAKVELK